MTKTKRLAIIGRGTSGVLSAAHFSSYMENCEIEWHYDSNIPVQSVGEGSTVQLPRNLYQTLNFNYLDLNKINATQKLGIYKSGWGKSGKDFLHQFPPPYSSLHFSATELQDFIFNHLKNKIKIYEHNAKESEIDADYILQCSGKPKSYDEYYESEFIPVNSAYITQCYWEYPRFNHTLTIARPYGWVFGIPLQTRCSIGYLYNKNINNLEEVKSDVKNIFYQYNLTPSENTNHLTFNNYVKKNNFANRVCYNGNASFFLEPMEASSIATMDLVQRCAFSVWNNLISTEMANEEYLNFLSQTQVMIMLHYFSGSKYNTEFWNFAQERGKVCIESAIKEDNNFYKMLDHVIKQKGENLCQNLGGYGGWTSASFFSNIQGMNIKDNILNLLKLV